MLTFNKLSFWEKQTYINHTDNLIVGSGIVGLSTAIYLKKRFPTQKVTIVEQGYLPTGASSKNAGFACIGSPSELLDDLQHTSEDLVFETVEKRWKGLLNLRQLLGDQNIHYQQLGSYELFKDTSFNESFEALSYLNEKLKSITGIKSVFQTNSKIIDTADFNHFNHAISHAAEGQIDTGKMIYNLHKLAIEKGIVVLNGIKAETYEKDYLETNYGRIEFKKLFICTNGFAKNMINEDIEPARAQVLITKPVSNLKFKGIYHFDKGYYYFRNVGNRVLFGGGRNLDLKTENTSNFENTELITEKLTELLSTHILPNTPFEVDYFWSGIMGVGQKKAPIVKQLSDHVYCGVRLGGMGVAIGSLVGKELADLA